MSIRGHIALGLVAAIAASASLGDDRVGSGTTRLVARPALVFNQHLYRGPMSRPLAVAYDKKRKEIWVAESDFGVVGVYRPDGAELFSFRGGDRIRDPACIAVTPEGDVAVIEGNRRQVRVFSYRGEYKGTLKLEGIGDRPILVAITWDEQGNRYVADNASLEVLVYKPSGALKFRFGSRGRDEGQFESIVALTVDDDGNIYVADARSLVVQVFDSQGNFLRGWGRREMGAENFSLPAGIAVDSKRRVIVTDTLRHAVKVFREDGRLLANFGGLGEEIGQLSFPTGVAIDEADRIIVTERSTSRVQVFELVEIPR